jgi:hypothetical protein
MCEIENYYSYLIWQIASSLRMEYLRYLVAALTALTLIMSVVSSVNPSNFDGLNAFADHEDEQEDDDNSNSSSRSNDDHEVEDDDDVDKHGADEQEEDENELVQPLGNHSKVFLELDDEAELEVEIEDGDLDDGSYDVMFTCESPEIDKEFTGSLNVTEGHGEFDADLGLSNDTYTGCEVEVGDLSTAFPTFTVIPDQHEDEDVQDEEDDDEHEDDKEDNDVDSSSGSNRHNDEDVEDDDENSGSGSHSSGSTEDKRKERKERIVSTTSGADVHERHRNANPHSPGEYDPGWNYTLAANGTAVQATDDENLMQEEDATVSLNMSVWKSNKAIILLDVIGGTVEYEDQDYTVRIGYALYSVQHDVMKVVALATDDEGNVIRLKLRGNAVDEADTFPMVSGSIDLILGGHFEDWNLLLEGTVEAN